MTQASDYDFANYWQTYRLSIAERRNWQCDADGCPYREKGCAKACQSPQTREENCPTLKAVDRLVSRLEPLLPDKAIAELNLLDYERAVNRLREIGKSGGAPYSEQTLRSYFAYIRDITRYAEDHGHAADALEPLTNEVVTQILTAQNAGVRKSAIEQYLERTMKKPRSLTFWQLEKLLTIAMRELPEDGRCMAVFLALYGGLRPAELRFVRWRDVKPFIDHSERHYVTVFDSRDAKGMVKGHVKTSNGFRKIPAHAELEILLIRRYQFVAAECQKQGVKENAWLDDPICCIGNDFATPCRDYELSCYLKRLFKQIKLSVEDLVPYIVDKLAKDRESGIHEDKDEVLALYVLRRTFWTLLNSCTQLSDHEKRYVMGHKIEVDGKSVRDKYNDEDRLWRICQKMDRCVYSRVLHADTLTETLSADQPLMIENRGILFLHIPEALLARGGALLIDVCTEDCGGAVTLRVLDALRPYFKSLSPQLTTEEVPASDTISGINTEYEVWVAHQKPARPERARREKNHQDTEEGDHNDEQL